MPPVFGAGVALADAFVVLRGGQNHIVTAGDDDEDRGLLAGEAVLDEDSLPCAGATALRRQREQGTHAGLRLLVALRHDHALAGRKPVGLDDDRRRRGRGDTRSRRPRPRRTRRGRSGSGTSGESPSYRSSTPPVARRRPWGRTPGSRPSPAHRPARAPAAPRARRRRIRSFRARASATSAGTSSAATAKQVASSAMPAIAGSAAQPRRRGGRAARRARARVRGRRSRRRERNGVVGARPRAVK